MCACVLFFDVDHFDHRASKMVGKKGSGHEVGGLMARGSKGVWPLGDQLNYRGKRDPEKTGPPPASDKQHQQARDLGLSNASGPL